MSKAPASLFIRLREGDNVVVARVEIAPGATVEDATVVTREPVPAGHKVATRPIGAGEPIIKYGTVVGFAGKDIAAGTWLHDHNVVLGELQKDYAFGADRRDIPPVGEAERATFMGYRRADGRVGTRNYIGVFASVNCSASVVHGIADWFTLERLADYPNVDGVVAFAHGTGCGMEIGGEPIALLRRTVTGYARHANMAAALLVGLGCERNQIGALLKSDNLEEDERLRTLLIQQEGGTRKTIEAGVAAVKQMLDFANRNERVSVPASELVVGLQCGASDGFSSITANPALGVASDIVVAQGGITILSETPEIYGVEQMLTRRAVSREVGEKLVDLIHWWEDYARGRDVQLNGVVSPGNMAGGLTNIVEKSLGAVMKAGTAPLVDVVRYAEPVHRKGLNFMDSPGYDPVATTGQVASGANIICFTTGRGSAYGCKPTPSIKIATNSEMYRRLEEDMDINCGLIADGEMEVGEMGERIFQAILEHASGVRTKSEELDIGRHEFVPWQLGIVS